MSRNLQNFAKFQKFQLVNLVDFEKCCKTHIYLKRLTPIQPKTSEILPKFCQTFATTLRVHYPTARCAPRSAGRASAAVGQPAGLRGRPHAELHRNSLRKYISRAKMHVGSSELRLLRIYRHRSTGGRGPGCPSAQRHSPPCPAGAGRLGASNTRQKQPPRRSVTGSTYVGNSFLLQTVSILKKCQNLEDSFSAVSKPIFASELSKY